jgi:CHAD domain-containing protein
VINHVPATQSLPKSLTVAEFSEQIIAKFLDKILHCELQVLQDTDPEPLHKMRVGMRRLHTVSQVLKPLTILPKSFSNKTIGQLAKKLGAVRDLDVMKELLQKAGEELPPSEQKILKKVAKSLARRRRRAFANMEQAIATNYLIMMQAGQQWLSCPLYRHSVIASQPITDILSDLLSPIIGEFFLHDGWWLMPTDLRANQAIVHDLRKCTKRIRYQTEFCAPCLSSEFTQFLSPLEASQECLGKMQDTSILRDFIQQEVGGKISKKMPVLIDRLEQKTEQAWQNWQPIRGQLCDQDWRKSLRRAVL